VAQVGMSNSDVWTDVAGHVHCTVCWE